MSTNRLDFVLMQVLDSPCLCLSVSIGIGAFAGADLYMFVGRANSQGAIIQRDTIRVSIPWDTNKH